MPQDAIQRALDLLGGTLERSEVLAGGDLSEVVRITLVDGRKAIVKASTAADVEAGMLEAIRASGAPAPTVLAREPGVLVLESLPHSAGIDHAWSALGLAMSRLHSATGDRYGWHDDYAFGPVAIDNTWSGNWPRFWAGQRLCHRVESLPRDLAVRLTALARSLPDRLPERPRPVLLHGDLWSGNVLADGNRVTGLIDPACYYGHCEVDFAMLGLFSRPGGVLLEAYGGLEAGHAERRPVYQLWPALVHLRLFGVSYRSMVERLLSEAGV